MLALVKFDDIKAVLDLEKDTWDDYPALKAIMQSVYAAFESYTGRFFEQDTYTETVPVDGQLLPLRGLPVSSVTSITSASGFDLTADATIRHDGLTLYTRWRESIEVVYLGGLEEAPGALTRAALLQIAHEWQRKDQIGATSSTNEGGSVSWPELGLLKEVRRLLDPYVHPDRMN